MQTRNYVCAGLLVAFLSLFSVLSQASSPQTPHPKMTVSDGGRCFFTMIPAKQSEPAGGAAHRLRSDGEIERLWKIEGWYSQRVFLTEDGEHLVVVTPLYDGRNRENPKDVIVLMFIEKGRVLRSYTASDLARDPVFKEYSPNWQFFGYQDTYLDSNRHRFSIRTPGDVRLEFDCTTGQLMFEDEQSESP